MQIVSLENTTYSQMLSAFNRAFSDYFIPVSVGIEQFTKKLESHNFDLPLSVGAFENNKLVGFILHGVIPYIDKKIIYNLGTGVIPSARGKNLSKKMYEYILPKLESNGCEQVLLEVVTKNEAAIKSYLNSGFSISRELSCYRGIHTKRPINQDYEFEIIENIALEQVQSLWDIIPTVQNSPELVQNRQRELSQIGAFRNNELIGYVIYNSLEKSVMQLAVDKRHRRMGVASSLLTQLKAKSEITFLNIDKKQTNITDFLQQSGLKLFIEQYEMVLKF